jgi:ParB-like chromosome segregation protein Spo0J
MPTKVEQLPTSSLTPYKKNTRVHSAGQVEKLTQSIRQFGFVIPILLNKQGQVIAGHGRLLAAKKLGLKTVPCIRATHLSEDQQRAYSIADNRLTELGGWNEELLSEELKALKTSSLELSLTGFTDVEILSLLEEEAAEATASFTSDKTVAQAHDAMAGIAASTSPQAVSAAPSNGTDAKRIEERKGFTVVGYCENYSQQLDALNALRVLGIKCAAK